MSTKFTYEWLDCNIIVTFFGEISINDIIDANNVIFGDIRFDKMEYQIFDYSNIEGIDLEEDVSEIISRLDMAANVWNSRVKVATITQDAYIRDLISVYNEKMQSSKWQAKTFDTVEDALKWCSLK
jgi:hypothetical protein